MESEGTLEKIEETLNLDEVVKVAKLRQLNRFLRQNWVLPTAVAVGGLAVGGAVVYVVNKRKTKVTDDKLEMLKQEHEILLENQLQIDFERAEKDAEFNKSIGEAAHVAKVLAENGNKLIDRLYVMSGVEKDVEEVEVVEEIPQPAPDEWVGIISSGAATKIATLKPIAPVAVDTDGDDEFVTANVFEDPLDPEWDWEKERSNRSSEAPYIIHVTEYVSDEMGWDSQSTLTYYEGDDILVDSKDVPIYNYPAVVGEIKFGHGSQDPNIVYVRNEHLRAEYEILRDEGSFSELVAGEEVEQQYAAGDLQHINRPLRMRRD